MPGVQAVNIGGRDADALIDDVPRDLITAVSEYSGVNLRLVVQLLEVVLVVDLVDKVLGSAGGVTADRSEEPVPTESPIGSQAKLSPCVRYDVTLSMAILA
jgi:hypothetical protein